MQGLDNILKKAAAEIDAAKDIIALDKIKVAYLGKKGSISEQLKEIGKLSAKERPAAGAAINAAKAEFNEKFCAKKQELEQDQVKSQLESQKIDITAPGKDYNGAGAIHPVSRIIERCVNLFCSQGFSMATGPEVESEYNNFTALNIPEHHPARAMHDTFYLDSGSLLRTHTSTVQINYMADKEPPIRLIAPGRVYRCDSDLTHTPMFHQLEGFVVDVGINFGHLKGLLHNFLESFFEKEIKMRLRPSYFPFTEPSAELDISCVICNGKGNNCRVCKNSGWLEVLGCGMIHPKVLANCNIKDSKYTGFAFGMGLDRLAMLYYGINDLRLMFEGDIRFLRQF